MDAMRTLKAKETYKEWITSLLKFVTPLNDPKPLSIEIINDTYKADSIKSGTRYKRGETTKRIHIRSWDQKMVKGKDWQSFLNNIDNKNDLINITGSFLRHETGRQNVTGNGVFTQNKKSWKISKHDAVEVFECNHGEADMRMVLHACLDDTNAVVVSRDTDVLVLLVHAFSIVKPTSQWFMKIDHQQYVDIGKACSYLGEEVSLRLPQVHAITGCDTTLFFFGVSKVKV